MVLNTIISPQKSSDFLAVVFSGFPKSGTPKKYNYMCTLEEVDCNQLFILMIWETTKIE